MKALPGNGDDKMMTGARAVGGAGGTYDYVPTITYKGATYDERELNGKVETYPLYEYAERRAEMVAKEIEAQTGIPLDQNDGFWERYNAEYRFGGVMAPEQPKGARVAVDWKAREEQRKRDQRGSMMFAFLCVIAMCITFAVMSVWR